MTYLLLKYIHIISSTFLFGTGLGSAFYMWRANQTNNMQAMLFATKNVVIADWIFTTPSVIIQPLSGLGLVHILHYPLTAKWILWSLCLYVLAGACWLPVVWLQIKMHKFLENAIDNNLALPTTYYRYERIWFILGWPAFIAVLVIFYLMVFKPM
ncbi:putative integral membrane protein [Legionella massiliensis]|uniref:Putative integral membrane protein n=1 Tax=Legionella massiliensis TaxID=1034943 RepID=A0A078L292_9GAMM|nr:DUF2269 domain-containing protein [Legionella massiliensis]CDZ78204.1 putative integral membrane protein [Legionella massiliensis]CEE13942.1 hypothetical protein BN1094_02512 [Legionella massiliensis]